MIEAAAEVAWSTDDGAAIVTGIMDALRRAGIPLPTSSRLERAGIAGRARARKRIHDALIATIGEEAAAKLDALLLTDGNTGLTPLAWVRDLTTAPKADNVRLLIEKLRYVRGVGLHARAAEAIHPSRFRQLAREAAPPPRISSPATRRRGGGRPLLPSCLSMRLG